MGYLISSDYLKQIQDVNLQQVISSNTSILTAAEKSAQYEAQSYLKQKYETAQEFTDTAKWVRTMPYSAADRVYLDAAAFVAATAYALNDLVLYSGSVYSCIVAGVNAWNASNWQLLGNQYAIFYAAYPFQLFDYKKIYNVGDNVYWAGNTYTCLIQTRTLDHNTALQYNQINNLPLGNVFPNDTIAGTQYWKNNGAYIVDSDTPIDNAAFWTAGDNRDAQMVEKLIDITLYHVHSRIAPRNIPALREVRYMGNKEDRQMTNEGRVIYPVYSSLGWLQACGRGEVTPSLPLLQPNVGKRIRYGGTIRNINSY